MNIQIERVTRLERKTKIFVPGFVLQSIRRYLYARERKRLLDPGFSQQLTEFWSEYPKALGSATDLRESKFYRMFDSSKELQESYFLARIDYVCSVDPNGSWMESSDPCIYKHFFNLSLEFFKQRNEDYSKGSHRTSDSS